MEVEELKQKYNVALSIRDSLPACEAEITKLEEDENVKKYLRLKAHQEKYEHLKHLTDRDILDGIIAEDEDLLTTDTYFCYGKDFIGHPKKIGGYYIDPMSTSPFRLQGTRVTKYQNIAKPSDIIIIPSTEAYEFEKTHNTIYKNTDNPEEEYKEIRRNMYLKLMRNLSTSKEEERETYFCLGRNFKGDITKDGTYTIKDDSYPGPYLLLSYYININNPDDIILISTTESSAFELDKNIILSTTNNPKEEYYSLREKLLGEKPKRLVKEPKND